MESLIIKGNQREVKRTSGERVLRIFGESSAKFAINVYTFFGVTVHKDSAGKVH